MSQKLKREALAARQKMHFLAGQKIACNRDDIYARILAWDAQVAAVKQKHSLRESPDSRQQSLPFSAARTPSRTPR